jgi:hypothetical protein
MLLAPPVAVPPAATLFQSSYLGGRATGHQGGVLKQKEEKDGS